MSSAAILVLALLALLALLAGCGEVAADSALRPTIYTDLNGCQYLSTNHDAGLTPRMGTDGRQVCQRAP